jgi:hypothetical protein
MMLPFTKVRKSKWSPEFQRLLEGVDSGKEFLPDQEEGDGPLPEVLNFRWQDVKWRSGFYKGEARKIPCVFVEIPPNLTITIYGSHLTKHSDYRVTHLFHRSRDVDLVPSEPPPHDHFPKWFPHLDLAQGQWYLMDGLGVHLKGAPSKGIFQGVMDDPDLQSLIYAVHAVVTANIDHSKFYEFAAKRLFKILIPAIRKHDLKKISLLMKVMEFCQMPRVEPKSLLYNDAFLLAARACNRVPTGAELYELVTHLDRNIEAPLFYRDLKEIGLGWITRKYKR